MSSNGSFSATDRTFACPGSLVLPKIRSQSSQWADRGTGLHGYIRAVLSGIPLDVALDRLDPADRETAARIDWRKLGGDLVNVRCEVAYAIDPVARTARELGVNIDRRYDRFDLGPNEIPGTNDIEGQTRDGLEVVLDVKTGWNDVPDARENGQILSLAAARYLVTGAQRIEGRVGYLRPDGSVWMAEDEVAVFDAFDLDCFLSDYEDALARVRATERVYLAGGAPTVSDGSWCRYCESMAYCPAYTRLARSMLTDAEAMATFKVEELTEDQCGTAWTKLDRILDLAETIKGQLKERGKGTPFRTVAGKMVRPIVSHPRRLDLDAACAMLRAKGANDGEIDSLYRTTESIAVRETNDPNAPKKPRAKKKAEAA